MTPAAQFPRTVAEFTRKLLTDYDVNEVLEELATRLNDLLGLVGSGVSLARGDRLEAVTAAPAGIAPLEHRQEVDQCGPCVTAFSSGVAVAIPDLEQETRWPEYRQIASELSIRSVAAVPLELGDRTVGSLDLYRSHAGAWNEEDLAAASVLANMATAFLINASALAKQTQIAEQLQYALDARVLVEQAKGILAEAQGLTTEQAFLAIRRYARGRNLKIHEVASAVIHMGVRPT